MVSGLLTGVLLSRTLASLLAYATELARGLPGLGGADGGLALVLRGALPGGRRPPAWATASCSGRPRGWCGSIPRCARALYQAAMFGAFSAFWTTIAFVLTRRPSATRVGVGVFALVGAGGARIAPLAGRWADRGPAAC